MNYISKVFFLGIFSFFSGFLYYFKFNHGENMKNFLFFMGIFSVIFLIYKIFQFFLTKAKKEITFSPAKIVGLFLIFLFVFCFVFFDFKEIKKSILLFLRIFYFLILPIFIFLITTSFGKKISSFLPKIKDFSENIRFLLSLNLGFFSFVFLLTIFSFFGYFNLYVVFAILSIFFVFSFKDFLGFLKGFFTKKIVFSKNEGFGIKLLTTEIFYLIVFFLFTTGLVSIIRPFPIGWDDLGVYMNYPNILASSSGIVNFSEMYSWQIFTGIGYLLKEPAFAFFLNFSGYFFSFLSLNLIFSDLLKSRSNQFLFLPTILSTLFLALPMSIFHSIKDIKLDQGLFFITIFIVFFLYKILEKKFLKQKVSLIYLFLIGVFSGFAFSIKFTSLYLIISILALLSLFFTGIIGFFGFLLVFFSIFSFGSLWNLMNVSIEANFFLNIFCLIFGTILIIFGGLKTQKLKKFLKNIFIFLLGVLFSLFPWLSKNIYDSYPDITISKIIKGNSEVIRVDLEKIFTKEEILEKNEEKAKRRLEDPVTTNEDLKRYLGYESGILPYIKLPWNLTMQLNQSGKFTEISFVFFALLPLIFIFLPFTNKNFYLFIILFLLFELFLFLNPNIFTENLKNFLAGIEIPFGYFIVFLFIIIPILLINYFLPKKEKFFIFRLNLFFSAIYIFLWSISSFGVVWYGITMYFCLLFMIGFCAKYIIEIKENDNSNEKFFGSLVFFLVFFSFLILTTIPHTISNFQIKSYLDYKTWNKSSLADSFDLHSGYEKIFFELNIKDSMKKDFINEKIDKEILKIEFSKTEKNISEIVDFLKDLEEKGDLQAKKSLENIYNGILYPTLKYQNPEKIFRLGTFMKYYISKNQERVFEDSLVFYFYDYIFDENDDKTWENFKKLGFKYLVLDLGTATIDNSKIHGLTKRYEALLSALKSEKLELIATDSICLRFATELGDKEKFFKISSISYDSYDEKGNKISRTEKLIGCAEEIHNFLKEDFDLKKFSYLKKYLGLDILEIKSKLPKSSYAIYKVK